MARMARRYRGKSDGNYWGSFVLDWFKFLQDNDLTRSDYKVLFLLCQKIKTDDNTAYVRQKEIAEVLKMDTGNVSKSIKRLCEKQFIARCQNGFMVNPHLFYIGMAGREEKREDFDQLLIANGLNPRFSLDEDYKELREFSGDSKIKNKSTSPLPF